MAQFIRRHRVQSPDAGLIPPEESRARRIRRLLWWSAIALVALTGGAYFFGAPLAHTIKSWHARRTAREAIALVEQEKWKEADEKARAAYQLSQTEPETWRAIARLLYRQGNTTASLEWWSRLRRAGQLSELDEREYAFAALGAGELGVAGELIEPLLAAEGPLSRPAVALLGAQLNSRRMNGPKALDYAQLAMRDPRAEPHEIISASLLVLAITAPESPPYAEAWKSLETIARETEDPMSLDALVQLTQLRPPQPPAPEQTKPFSELVAPPVNPAQMSALEIADALERHPRAGLNHRLLAMQMRIRAEPWRAHEYITAAVGRFGGRNDEAAQALATWLNRNGRPDVVLEFLPLDRAVLRRDFSMSYLDALAALGKWSEMKDVLSAGRLQLDPMTTHMYLGAAHAKLGNVAGETGEWQRALEAADSADKFFNLAAYAEGRGKLDIANEAYGRAIELAPEVRAAYAARLRIAQQRAQTAPAHEIAARMVKNWPSDVEAQETEMYLRLLLGGSCDDAMAAEQAAEKFVQSNAGDWNARKLLALARLRLGRNAEALDAFSGTRVTGTEPPGALAVRAAALFANGWRDGARNDARNLAGEYLLPEERALLGPILRE